MARVLTQTFFKQPTLTVARELIGATLVHKGKRGVIMEVEAYDGPHDKASHAHRGKTKRNEPMFGKAGVWYVYLCYGMHHMLNIVTGEKEYPAAVLIRGVVLEDGTLLDGPGKVTKVFGVTTELNRTEANKRKGLWIEARGNGKKPQIERLPRVGIGYAGEWADKPYRFRMRGL